MANNDATITKPAACSNCCVCVCVCYVKVRDANQTLDYYVKCWRLKFPNAAGNNNQHTHILMLCIFRFGAVHCFVAVHRTLHQTGNPFAVVVIGVAVVISLSSECHDR